MLFLILILVCGVLVMGVVWTALVAKRRRVAQVVVTSLRTAVRSGLPLVDVVGNAALTERGKVGRRLRDLFMGLDEGARLAHCLDDVPELSRGERGMIDAAERQGRLEAGLAQLERRLSLDAARRAGRSGDVADWLYPLIVLASAMLVGSALMVFVVPSYSKIAADFDMPQPGWLAVLEYHSWASNWPAMLAVGSVLVVVVAFVVPAVPAFWAYFKKGPSLESLTARLAWWTPGIGRAVRDSARSDAFFILSMSVASGLPMEQAADSAADAELNPVLTSRLRRWRERLAAGEAIGGSAGRCGLGWLAGTMLDNATRTGGMTETLMFLSEYFEARRQQRLAWLRAAVLPVLTLIGAVVVGAFGYLVIHFGVLLNQTVIEGVTW